MKPPILLLLFALLFFCRSLQAGTEETKTIIAGAAATDMLTLNEGDSAKLTYACRVGDTNASWDVTFRIKTAGKTIDARSGYGSGTIEVAGPATIQVLDLYPPQPLGKSVAMFKVTRAGQASPPAGIPIEAGSNFNVILESSSDLVNWTPANPGTYSGTEVKRFFRTRIVKQ